jgi:hypothetical protein
MLNQFEISAEQKIVVKKHFENNVVSHSAVDDFVEKNFL